MLTRRLLKQGYRYDHLCSCFRRFFNKHVDISTKYKITVKQHIKVTITSLLINIHEMFSVLIFSTQQDATDVVGRIHDSVPRINQQA